MADGKISMSLLATSDYGLSLICGEATHQHFKGGLYRMIGPVKDAETGEPLLASDGSRQILYQHCYPHEREYWVRSETECAGYVDTPEWHPYKGGCSPRIRRFRPLGQGWGL